MPPRIVVTLATAVALVGDGGGSASVAPAPASDDLRAELASTFLASGSCLR